LTSSDTIKVFDALVGAGSGEDAGRALVTVVRTSGSTPRKAGSKMVVKADGNCVGTIGGGCIEAEARRLALIAIDTGNPALHTVHLTENDAADEGMVCGGTMELLIEPVGSRGVDDSGERVARERATG